MASNIDIRDYLYVPVAIDNSVETFGRLYLNLYAQLVLSAGGFQNLSNANPTTFVLKPYVDYTVDTYTPASGQPDYSGRWRFNLIEAGGTAYERVCVVPALNTSSVYTYNLQNFSLVNTSATNDIGTVVTNASLLLRFPGNFTFKMQYDSSDGRNVKPAGVTDATIRAFIAWNKLTLGILPAYVS